MVGEIFMNVRALEFPIRVGDPIRMENKNMNMI